MFILTAIIFTVNPVTYLDRPQFPLFDIILERIFLILSQLLCYWEETMFPFVKFCTLKPAAFSSFSYPVICICYFNFSCDRHFGLYYVSVCDHNVL